MVQYKTGQYTCPKCGNTRAKEAVGNILPVEITQSLPYTKKGEKNENIPEVIRGFGSINKTINFIENVLGGGSPKNSSD
jgi:hypothetical protein